MKNSATARQTYEKCIIHECFNDYSRCLEAIKLLDANDFADHGLGLSFNYIKKIVKRNEIPDFMNFTYEYENDQNGIANFPNLLSVISPLVTEDIYNAHDQFLEHCYKLKDYGNADRIKVLFNDCVDRINKGESYVDVRSYFQGEIDRIDIKSNTRVKSINDARNDLYQEIVDNIQAKKDGKSIFAQSGFPTLDRLTGGFRKGQLIILGALTGRGKTSMAYKMACATSKNGNVLYITREMPYKEMALRDIALNSGIDMPRLNSMDLNEKELKTVRNYIDQNNNRNIFIDDKTGSIEEIKVIAMNLKLKHGLDLIVIDYLQLLDRGNYNNDVQAIDYIARELKTLAQTVDVPVIALSQLNNEADIDDTNRNDDQPHIPKLKNLRGSGAIQQNADIVLFLCRKENSNIAKLVIAKGRNCGVGIINLYWNGEKTEYTELATNLN